MLVLCLVIQIFMVKFKLETWQDAAIVAVFHLLGLALEIYKVNQGSWSYPEFAYTKVAGAPLYSGFMHGSVASFMCLAWKRLKLSSLNWPNPLKTWLIAAVLYALFFVPTNGSLIRLVTLAIILIVFIDCTVHYTVAEKRYQMPMSLAFLLIGFMIYIAENIATYFGAWKYPYQLDYWQPVHSAKIVSWSLLMIVSLIIVAEYKRALNSKAARSGAIPLNRPASTL